MISSVLILSPSNQIIIKRDYSDYFSTEFIDRFIETHTNSLSSELRSPMLLLENYRFLTVSVNLHNFVLITKFDVLASALYQFLYSFITLIRNYTKEISTHCLSKNRTLISELLDETVDYGIPQLVSQELIAPFILYGKPLADSEFLYNAKIFTEESTRSNVLHQNKKMIKQPEVFLSIEENLKIHFDADGKYITKEVNGLCKCEVKVVGKSECTLKLNRLTLQNVKGKEAFNFKFNACVDLDAYNRKKEIKFTPPEKAIKLIEYSTSNLNGSPMKIHVKRTSPRSNIVNYAFSIETTFDDLYSAKEIVVSLPAPKNTVKLESKYRRGRFKYIASNDMVEFRLHKLKGKCILDLEVDIHCKENDKEEWAKDARKVQAKFCVPFYTESYFIVDELDITGEYLGEFKKWVSYHTNECHIICDIKK